MPNGSCQPAAGCHRQPVLGTRSSARRPRVTAPEQALCAPSSSERPPARRRGRGQGGVRGTYTYTRHRHMSLYWLDTRAVRGGMVRSVIYRGTGRFEEGHAARLLVVFRDGQRRGAAVLRARKKAGRKGELGGDRGSAEDGASRTGKPPFSNHTAGALVTYARAAP